MSDVRYQRSKFARSALLILTSVICLLTSACGFEPVYGVNRNTAVGVESKLAQVEIANIPDREGQYLRNQLIDRFYRGGYPESPQWELGVRDMREKLAKLDVTKTSDATRGQLRMDARMVLRDLKTGSTILERKLRSSASYNIVGSEFANRVTEDNARLNALNDLARQVELQLGLYFKRGQ